MRFITHKDVDVENDAVVAHAKMIIDMKSQYKKCKKVEFSYTNNYVIIDGVCYNGISKEIFKKITKEIKFKNGEEPVFIDWKKCKLR